MAETKTETTNQFENYQPQVEALSQLKVGDEVEDENKNYKVRVTDATIRAYNPNAKSETSPILLGEVIRSEKYPGNVGKQVKILSSGENPDNLIFAIENKFEINEEVKKHIQDYFNGNTGNLKIKTPTDLY